MNKSLSEIERDVIACRRCPRLVGWREQVAQVKRKAYLDQEYWGKPVPAFGDPQARILVLGLAPGAHGSNRTGRMFTGDGSGNFLYPSLYRTGFASMEQAVSRDDGMELRDILITAICKCVPPANKPNPDEIRNCRPWLEAEVATLTDLQGVVVLGQMAWDGLFALPLFSHLKKSEYPFGHGAFYKPPRGLPWVLCSYHPSLQNTQTGKLTAEMFDAIWLQARSLLR